MKKKIASVHQHRLVEVQNGHGPNSRVKRDVVVVGEIDNSRTPYKIISYHTSGARLCKTTGR